LYTLHHITADGLSMRVLNREIGVLYDAFSSGQTSPLFEQPIQYADYAVWQRGWLRGDLLEEQMTYWKKQLGGALPMFRLAPDGKQPDLQSSSGRVQFFSFAEKLSEQLRSFSQREGVTLFMVLLAAFKGLLYRHSNQPDAVVGTDLANRNRAEIEGLIGFFVNQLVLRTDLSGNPTLREILQRVRKTCLAAYVYQDLPFEKLVATLNPERYANSSPLFQTKLVLQNMLVGGDGRNKQARKAADAKRTDLEICEIPAKFDLLLDIVDGEGQLTGTAQYKTSLYTDTTIRLLLTDFETTLAIFISQPELRLVDLSKALEKSEKQEEVKAQAEARKINSQRLQGIKRKAEQITNE
jgi:non-ribosomal peptide synthetase component F